MHNLLVVVDVLRWKMSLRVRDPGKIQLGKVRVVKPLGRIVCYFSSFYLGHRNKDCWTRPFKNENYERT
jgi:hypothetical protein